MSFTSEYSIFCENIKTHWTSNNDKNRLSHVFRPGHNLSEEKIKLRIGQIHRGKALIVSARKWEDPSIGPKENPSQYDYARGIQWQLVVATAGLEMLIRGMTGAKSDLYKKRETITQGMNTIVNLRCPSIRKGTREWLNEQRQQESNTEMKDFWSLNEHGWRIVFNFLVDEKPIQNIKEALALSTALRNATVHGFLSANKVVDLKLHDIFKKLTTQIILVSENILHVLNSRF